MNGIEILNLIIIYGFHLFNIKYSCSFFTYYVKF